MTLSPAVRPPKFLIAHQGILSWVQVGRGAEPQGETDVGQVLFCLMLTNPRTWHLSAEWRLCELASGQGCSVKSGYSGQVPVSEVSTGHDLLQD